MNTASILLRVRRLLEKPYIPELFLILIAAVCYLPLANKLGLYNDDWYLIYAGTSQGAEKFIEVFEIDRPLRGYLVGFLFDWFGVNAPLYSYTAFILRCLGAFGLLWLLRRIWPKARLAAYLAAVWLALYPGFLDQPNAIDYQSHLFSFTLAIFSIYFSIQALYAAKLWVKGVLVTLAVLLQLSYLGLMEYYIGLEGLRFLLIGYIIFTRSTGKWIDRLREIVLQALPTLLGASGFLIWRIFIFNSQRQATDVETMFTDIAGSPALRVLWMLVLQVQDFVNTVVFAWFEPVYRLAFNLRLKYSLEMFAWAGAAVLLFALAMAGQKENATSGQASPARTTREQDMIWLGILGVICALLPTHLGERHIVFQDFGRFSLPGSVGAVMILAGLWHMQPKTWWRWIMPVGLVLLAGMTHYANARVHAENWETVKDFWWQVSWRIPQLAPQTVLVASYPDQGIAEDYFVWGPANLIYYPESTSGRATPLTLLGSTLNIQDIQAIQTSAVRKINRRGFSGSVDYANTLILTMPGIFSCVHILDGERPELSSLDRTEIGLIAPYSHPELIEIDSPAQTPPSDIFGAEPAHGWCYYYQQASLARQRGDWQEVVRLGDEAEALGLRASDWIEWTPFLEGYAYQGVESRVRELSAIIREDLYLRHRACELILKDSQAASEHPQGHQQLVDILCTGQ